MGRRTAKEAEALREEIVGEALRQFANNGVDATSVAAIARRVGVSKQTLMHHFRTKELLVAAIQERIKDGFSQSLPHLIAAFSAKDAQLDSVLWDLIQIIDEQAEIARFILRQITAEKAPTPTPESKAIVTLFRGYLRQGQEQGVLRQDFNPEDALYSLGMLFLSVQATVRLPGVMIDASPADLRLRRYRELIRITRAALLPPAPLCEE